MEDLIAPIMVDLANIVRIILTSTLLGFGGLSFLWVIKNLSKILLERK